MKINKSSGEWYIFIAVLLLGALTVSLAYYKFANPKISAFTLNNASRPADVAVNTSTSANTNEEQPIWDNDVTTPDMVKPADGKDAFGAFTWYPIYEGMDQNLFGYGKDYSQNFSKPFQINWKKYDPAAVATADQSILKKIYPDFNSGITFKGLTYTELSNIKVSEAGEVASGTLAGAKLYFISADNGVVSVALYSTKLNKFVYFSTPLINDLQNIPFFAGSVSFDLLGVKAPSEKIALPGDQSFLALRRGGILSFISGEFFYPFATTSSVNAKIEFTDAKLGPVYHFDNHYKILLPIGQVATYEIEPYFLKLNTPVQADKQMYPANSIAGITWLDGVAGDNKYTASSKMLVGCGGEFFPEADDAGQQTWFSEANLVKIGKTSKGEFVYGLSDAATNEAYNKVYDFGFIGSLGSPNGDGYILGGKKYTYEEIGAMPKDKLFAEFLAERPLFFWKDKFGHWHMYQRSKYQSMAECGKPVIYLYPEKTTDVHVQVVPNGGFTKTEPAYGENGWLVRATPNSELFNYADKTTYPYLFWEGHGFNYEWPKKGFVIAKNEVATKVSTALRKLGLNEKETKDFMEFWQEKLEKGNYARVTFVPQNIFNVLAPLKVEPKPNSVIRVFMDYELSSKPDMANAESIESYLEKIKTPERKGFTVVEWGGVLHK